MCNAGHAVPRRQLSLLLGCSMVNSVSKAVALSFPWMAFYRFTKSVWQETQTATTGKLEAGGFVGMDD